MEKRRLSIFSSETLALSGVSFPFALVTAVLMVLAVEVGLHLYEDRLPEPILWGGGETSVKVAQVQSMVKPGEKKDMDVLVLGPSHASLGISPAAMKSVAGVADWNIYNGGLNGRTYTVVNFVSRHVYEENLSPDLAVLTMSPLIVSQSNTHMERNSREFFSAPMPKALTGKDIERRWCRFLAEDVCLFKYRKREANLSKGYMNGEKIVDEYGYHGVDGVFDDKDRKILESGNHVYSKILGHCAYGGPSAKGFEELVTRLNSKGCTVVVINMPFRQELMNLFRNGQSDYNRIIAEVKELRREIGFTWLDYEEMMTFDDSEFTDVDHLNREGAKRFSIQLAKDLLKIRTSLSIN